MAFGGGNTGGVRSDINITPLVDVVLVLLIIFMVMTPTLLKEMDVAVPEKSDIIMAAPSTKNQIIVSINKDGKLAVSGEPTLDSELAVKLHEALAAKEGIKLVFFDIDDDANYGEAVHAMDIARGAGATTLGLMNK